jgi:ankyrin repeat protein
MLKRTSYFTITVALGVSCAARAMERIEPTPASNLGDQLCRAAAEGRRDLVKFLLKHGAHIESRDDSGVTPLYHAAEQGHLEVMRYLLKRRAQIKVSKYNREDERRITLREAIEQSSFIVEENRRQAVLKLLADALEEEKYNNKILMYRIGAGDLRAVEEIITKRRVDINARDGSWNTPLILAARWGHVAIVKFLLEQGADTTLANEDGQDARAVALSANQFEIAQIIMPFLMQARANDDMVKVLELAQRLRLGSYGS